MRLKHTVLLLPALALAACSPPADRAEFVSKAPAAKIVGEPVSCITTSTIRDTKVHDDRTIDFITTGSRIYRNTLPGTCPRLGFEEGFTYTVHTSRLCDTDIIYVLDRTAGDLRRGAGCGLGKFVPVEYAEGSALQGS
ncbi:hypothetical protein GRI44_12360 [Altererythrobacter confluentis]|uniref:Lipoprotein n=1 Tax=Allopontixanthobacter confluentis TaxID=1849021 RepID=A0A6L7GJQ4_9SPHN|nr:hypothetical protein [Allopontixanthobacter confluentis]